MSLAVPRCEHSLEQVLAAADVVEFAVVAVSVSPAGVVLLSVAGDCDSLGAECDCDFHVFLLVGV